MAWRALTNGPIPTAVQGGCKRVCVAGCCEQIDVDQIDGSHITEYRNRPLQNCDPATLFTSNLSDGPKLPSGRLDATGLCCPAISELLANIPRERQLETCFIEPLLQRNRAALGFEKDAMPGRAGIWRWAHLTGQALQRPLPQQYCVGDGDGNRGATQRFVSNRNGFRNSEPRACNNSRARS